MSLVAIALRRNTAPTTPPIVQHKNRNVAASLFVRTRGGNCAKPPQARKARRPTAAGRGLEEAVVQSTEIGAVNSWLRNQPGTGRLGRRRLSPRGAGALCGRCERAPAR